MWGAKVSLIRFLTRSPEVCLLRAASRVNVKPATAHLVCWGVCCFEVRIHGIHHSMYPWRMVVMLVIVRHSDHLPPVRIPGIFFRHGLNALMLTLGNDTSGLPGVGSVCTKERNCTHWTIAGCTGSRTCRKHECPAHVRLKVYTSRENAWPQLVTSGHQWGNWGKEKTRANQLVLLDDDLQLCYP